MNIKPKQYAIALFESLKDAKDKEQKEIVQRFVSKLIDNNDISKIEPMISYFEELFNKYEDIAEAQIISVYELDKNILSMLKKLISERTQAENINISEKKDKGLLGGVVLRYGDRSLDLSLKRRLEGFKRQMIS